MEAAIHVARRKGLATTTVRDVAAAMGTSSGLIHHYFDSMDEVLAAAFERVARSDLEEVDKRVSDASSPREALAAFFVAYAPAETDWAFQMWLDAWSEASRRPALRAISVELNVAWQQLVAGIIRDGVAAGEFTCPDPEVAAWRIISLLDGLLLQVVAHHTTVSRRRMLEWTRQAACRELGLAAGALDPAGDPS